MIDLDEIDIGILGLLQENCRISMAKLGGHVELSAPSVVERVKKLEDGGLILGYRAILDARSLGVDVAAFIGVTIDHTSRFAAIEAEIALLEDVLECHHDTGGYSLLLKVRTQSTATLEQLISRLRSVDGVDRTETMVVLSTHAERTQIPLGHPVPAETNGRRGRRGAERPLPRSTE